MFRSKGGNRLHHSGKGAKMGRPVRVQAEALERARRDVREAQSAAQLRAALAVVLPVDCGLSARETGVALGRQAAWVSRTRNQYMSGKAEFSGLEARGGRRNQLFTDAKEIDLVKEAIINSERSWQSVRRELRLVLMKETDSDPAESTISAMLSRVAPKIVPGCDVWDLRKWRHKVAAMLRTEKELHSFMFPYRR
jgi:hypothetical protein